MKETEGEEFEELQINDASKAVGEVLRNLKDKMVVSSDENRVPVPLLWEV